MNAPIVPCLACPLSCNPLFEKPSEDELEFMQGFKIGELTVEPGRTVMMEGATSAQFYTVLEGLGLRQKTFPNGQRQVISFVLPGDLVGLQAAVMGEMQHSVEATTRMTLCVFDRNGLWDLFRNQPKRAYSVTWLSAVEENFLGETLATIGQLDATQRIAWALVRLHDRLAMLADASGTLVERGAPVVLPYRQQDLADALGLSLVHTNKTLARLRADGLADWSQGRLALPGRQKLAEIAMIDAEVPVRPLL
ncbi:Crp/Fnr family transcriptional regulator [Frigidibacter sp. MR17.14]|uniref:Crp/Fnr family transcriptional regulator n=1 Tax=Frigidibacter sp. MR17.14 TaxID=3126509 RepID=UPI003012CDE6